MQITHTLITETNS